MDEAQRDAATPSDVLVPADFEIEPVVRGLTFPSGVTFDDRGVVYVVESGYSYGETFATARLLRVEPDASTHVVATGTNGPWTGVSFHAGNFYVSEGGQSEGGRILRITPSGERRVLVEGLPGQGDHHTNGPVVSPDGWVYFGQGTATNSGVVGPDNAKLGWLGRHPDVHDVPCRDVHLRGVNFESDNPLESGERRVTTGAYVPYGTPSTAGQLVDGRLPCSGAVLRVRADGGPLELVAWGLRNPFGLAFDAKGALFVTDNGADERGSRPIFGSADALYRVEPGAWYGWPDHSEGRPLAHDRYAPPGGPQVLDLIDPDPGVPPRPVAYLPVHASADGFDISRSASFGYVGQAFVALFGDQSPEVGKVLGPVGFKVIRVNLETGVSYDFALNRGDESGPASLLGSGGLERPIAARFDPRGAALYVVDFGVLAVKDGKFEPRPSTGSLWKIRRTGAPR
ncbi:MAG TPA: PQQ-dependent sugar dehydrogenase [Polyangiaceae bacterium]|nr:PQQ-dependent sugar dehydrogenase [Polyangiaceae bacterium]